MKCNRCSSLLFILFRWRHCRLECLAACSSRIYLATCFSSPSIFFLLLRRIILRRCWIFKFDKKVSYSTIDRFKKLCCLNGVQPGYLSKEATFRKQNHRYSSISSYDLLFARDAYFVYFLRSTPQSLLILPVVSRSF